MFSVSPSPSSRPFHRYHPHAHPRHCAALFTGVTKSYSNVNLGSFDGSHAALSSLYNIASSSPDDRLQLRRADCLGILQWRGGVMADGERERIDVTAIDDDGNSALHLAAASGLAKCVEILVHQGAPLFVENKLGTFKLMR